MATYPSAIVTSFTTHVNSTEIVDASHPNLIQAEVVAIESTLGVTPNISGPFSITRTVSSVGSTSPDISTYVYKAGSTFGSMTDRVTNVENLAATAYSLAAGLSGTTGTLTSVSTALDNLYKINLLGGF